jgi:hypothetical protein
MTKAVECHAEAHLETYGGATGSLFLPVYLIFKYRYELARNVRKK